ncbi:pentatricopeptide repeat-containing protein At5g57250, mitochondrial [Cornus florida]|uniref:pentatricopeptide repeat-containing protein At5g57250, mitochondrial n=1 Tax=Cornus florida TaxID=4283 RepID=UPI00289EF7F0|nr:pentatricopeptide repeat-containing protein At5g57250, mitochondrial [Cornus florida]
MILSKLFNAKPFSSLSSSYLFQLRTPSLQTLLKSGFSPILKDFEQFLLFLSQSNRFNSIIQFVSQMNSNHIEGSSRTHSIFAWALLEEHKYEEAKQFMETQKAKTAIHRQTRIWDSLIQGICMNQKDPEKALLVLRDCLRIDGILPSSFTFCSLIHSFSSLGMMDRAIEVLELMNDEKIKYPFDNFVCSSVISGFCKIGKPELAIGFYENARNSAVLQPNVVTYTALVSAYCRLGRIEEVCNLVSRIEKEGLAPDVVFYSSWIYELFTEGNIGEAFRKHREMMMKKIDMDTISYSILIDGFSKEGNVEKAVGFLNKMKMDKLEPNLITYTAIVLGFCKKGKLEAAFSLVKMVDELGIKIDEFMYATLIAGVCRRGDFDLVFNLLSDMENKGISPSIVTYNTVIDGLCKAGRTSEADEISKGILCDAVTYSTLLHGYIEEENSVRILETKRRLEEAGVCLDVVMCNVLIKALFMVGSSEDALEIFREMPELNLAPDSVTYCTMIDGFCKLGRIDQALEIFDEFRRTTISSVACYNCIIHGLCRKGMVGVAIEVFIELNERALASDVGMHMLLFKSIFEENGAEGILELLCKIENLGHDMFGVICNDAICFLCKRGFSEATCEVYMIMRRTGSAVTNKSYYSILKVLDGDGKNWLIQPFLNTLVKVFGIVEPRVSKILINYLCMKDVNSALKFLDKMKENKLTVTFPVTVIETLMKDGRVLDAYKLIMGAKDNLPLMNVVDYSIVVDGLCKAGHVDKALDLCAFVKMKGITLSIVTYNSVIHGLCCQGCLVEALRLFDSLEKIDRPPSEITYAILIDARSKEGYLVDAKNLFEMMVLKGFKPNTRVFNSLIDGYCKFGQMKEVLKLLLDLEVRCLKPDEFTVSAVINGCCQNGDMEQALGFFFEYKRKGFLPDFLGFMYLLRGLYTKGRMEECRSILREMLQTQSVVDLLNRADIEVKTESIESFLILLCEQGSIQEAITILNEVGSMFFPVKRRSGAYNGSQKITERSDKRVLGTVESKSSISTFETDIDFESCNMEKLEKVGNLEKISQSHDFDSYHALIASLCSRGELGKANKLVRMLYNFDSGG